MTTMCRVFGCKEPINALLINDADNKSVGAFCGPHATQFPGTAGYHLKNVESMPQADSVKDKPLVTKLLQEKGKGIMPAAPSQMAPPDAVFDEAYGDAREDFEGPAPAVPNPPIVDQREQSKGRDMRQQVVPVSNGRVVEGQSQQLTAAQVKGQVQLIQEVLQAVMQEGYHYGVIPGTEKPTLLKPGAEKLCITFRLAPLFSWEEKNPGGEHREYVVKCSLTHIPSGQAYGEGVGSCSTMESRYRYRKGERTCPQCGKAAIIKGRAEYGGGWLCFGKKGGCGAKFADQDPAILSQATDRVENADLPDLYNTILKMAQKRALVAATLVATGASDIFTQDLEDFTPEVSPREEPKPQLQRSAPAPQQAPAPTSRPSPSPNTELLTKGQLEIILLSLRRSSITGEAFQQHLQETYRITDPKQLPRKDVNAVLEWLSQ